MKTKFFAAAILVLIAGASLTAIAQRGALRTVSPANPQGSVTATRHGGAVDYTESPVATGDVGVRTSSLAVTATRSAGGVHISKETQVAQDSGAGSSTKTCTNYGGQVICN
ncbi:MAG: hypothetical protein JWR07_2487 [Nevskia sp.]|nr:hypothetical protein [Nevskia sp.]